MIRVSKADFDIRKIADSGQCFRMNEISKGIFQVIAFDKVIYIREEESEYLFGCEESDYKNIWYDYFDLGNDYKSYISNVPIDDDFLNRACEYGSGIRILGQDPWEMLITFIISQRKNIPAIKSSVEALSKKYGLNIASDYKLSNIGIGNGIVPDAVYAFPSVRALSLATADELKACSLGYRVPYIMDTSKAIDSNIKDFESLKYLEDNVLLDRLLEYKGVGVKVASCVILFGYHRLGAFPIDVWINRVIKEHYNGEFPIDRYQGYAGVIQQYMFYYGRSEEYSL